jgi:hypothetical protein
MYELEIGLNPNLTDYIGKNLENVSNAKTNLEIYLCMDGCIKIC